MRCDVYFLFFFSSDWLHLYKCKVEQQVSDCSPAWAAQRSGHCVCRCAPTHFRTSLRTSTLSGSFTSNWSFPFPLHCDSEINNFRISSGRHFSFLCIICGTVMHLLLLPIFSI
ncbi:unnamed protein product [Amoebophrya sp. A120]|nr:unnamed protein product [Amoebophrya sp. A120]|eukprot:GSA120T00018459001.1